MKLGLKQERGFTLIEVLAAIVILSIVSLVLTSYFTNAMSYSKANQNKTIMVNLARNALFYVEKEDFGKLQTYFVVNNHSSIAASDCQPPKPSETDSCSGYSGVVSNNNVLAHVLNPVVNGISYQINIEYQRSLHQEMVTSKDTIEKETSKYLIPVRIRIRDAGRVTANVNETVVEGYITDEKIR
ncbi:type IV pilus modification PilV family protein [Paenibacillus donghaensis]|nr:type II secretion system protein [Paenibacillus donghaensis]